MLNRHEFRAMIEYYIEVIDESMESQVNRVMTMAILERIVVIFLDQHRILRAGYSTNPDSIASGVMNIYEYLREDRHACPAFKASIQRMLLHATGGN